jgi:hypothetical protein
MHAVMHGACLHVCGRFGTTDLVSEIKISTSLIRGYAKNKSAMPVVGWCILGVNINEKLKEIQTCPHEISQEEIKKVLQS